MAGAQDAREWYSGYSSNEMLDKSNVLKPISKLVEYYASIDSGYSLRNRKILELKKEQFFKRLVKEILEDIYNAITYCENEYVKKSECIDFLRKYIESKIKSIDGLPLNDYDYIIELGNVIDMKGINYVIAKYGISKSYAKRIHNTYLVLKKLDLLIDKNSIIRRLSKSQLIELTYALQEYPEGLWPCLIKYLEEVPTLPSNVKEFRKKIREYLRMFKSWCRFEYP